MIKVPKRYRRTDGETDGRTDGRTIYDRNTALCTKVHRAVTKQRNLQLTTVVSGLPSAATDADKCRTRIATDHVPYVV